MRKFLLSLRGGIRLKLSAPAYPMKWFILFVLLVVLGLFGVSRWNQHRRAPESYTPAHVSQLHLGETPVLAALDAETTRLVQAVVPAVVSITTSRKVTAPQIVDPFEFFFGRRRGQPAPQESVKNSLGSGVIVSKEGHILTNYHVVANVDEVLVQLNDGRPPYPARLIGGDDATDIAVIKIEVKGLPCLPLGDSDTVKVGQLVFAVGNPFGLQETVTKGIISATGRVTDEYGMEYFQTEAVINPGNSGGPLLNIRGEIIGINTAIGNYSGSGTWQGVGFAIPSNIARRSLEGILKNGRVARGYLGVAINPLTPEMAEQLGLPEQTGAMIRSITPGSPAEKAGLQPGDVLVAINGKPIQGARDLVRQIAAAAVGSKVEIKVIRDKQEQTLSVTIEEQPPGFKIGPPPQPQPTAQPPLSQQPQQPKRLPLAPSQPLAGIFIGVTPIPKVLLANYPENVRGVYVESIGSSGEGNTSLQPGDVIEQINGQPVANPEEFVKIAQNLQSAKSVLLSIARGKVRSFVVLQAGG